MSSSNTINRYSSTLTWARQNYHAINDGRVAFQRTHDGGAKEDVTAEVREYLYDIIEIVEGIKAEDRRKNRRI